MRTPQKFKNSPELEADHFEVPPQSPHTHTPRSTLSLGSYKAKLEVFLYKI